MKKVKLRRWQEDLVRAWSMSTKKVFIIEAAPSAGKTMGAGAILDEVKSRGIHPFVWVVPNDYYRDQVSSELHDGFGLDLEPNWSGLTNLPPGCDGVVITYQFLINNYFLVQRLLDTNGFVVLDEIHHLADEKTWGERALEAFKYAKGILGMTGTAFREDDFAIPFAEYVKDASGRMVLKVDFRYTIREGLSDGIIKPYHFVKIGGVAEWREWVAETSAYDRHRTVSFEEDVPKRDIGKRLRTAIRPETEFTKKGLTDAHNNLLEIRSCLHPRAAGLVVVPSIPAAKEIRKVLQKITGEDPVVVTSDDREAKNNIDLFKKSNKCWIVAVNMISEGISITRLTVLVYLTNVKTRLRFRQNHGRVTRVDPDYEAHAVIYIPDDPDLNKLAAEANADMEHFFVEQESSDRDSIDTKEVNDTPADIPLGATGEDAGAIDVDGNHYTAEEMERVRVAANSAGVKTYSLVDLARFLRSYHGVIILPSTEKKRTAKTPSKRRKELRDIYNARARQYSRRKYPDLPMSAIPWNKIHLDFSKRDGFVVGDADETVFLKRIAWLDQNMPEAKEDA